MIDNIVLPQAPNGEFQHGRSDRRTEQQFATLASAIAASNDGDTIDVQAGTHVDDFATITKNINLVDALSTVLSVRHGISVGSIAGGGSTVSNSGGGSEMLTGTAEAIDASLYANGDVCE